MDSMVDRNEVAQSEIDSSTPESEGVGGVGAKSLFQDALADLDQSVLSVEACSELTVDAVSCRND